MDETINYYVVYDYTPYANGQMVHYVTKDELKAKAFVRKKEIELNITDTHDYGFYIAEQAVTWQADQLINNHQGYIGHNHDLNADTTITYHSTCFILDQEIDDNNRR